MNVKPVDQQRIAAIKAGKKHMQQVAAMSPEAQSRVRAEEERKIQEFISMGGVSMKPASWAGGSQFSVMFGTDL